MTLLNATMLIVAGALAVPILLHLIYRQEFPVVNVPTTRFLDVTRRSNVFHLRFVDVLQLLLRLGVLTLLVAAIARPFVASSRWGPGPVANRVLVLDTSVRMQARTEGATCIERARAEVSVGKHVLWPGNHEFEVTADGKVVSQDPELIVEKASVRLKCYPVKMLGYWANSALSLPVTMRTFPLGRCAVFASDPPLEEADRKKKETARAAATRQRPPADIIEGRIGRRVRVDGKLPPEPRDEEWTDLLPVYERFAPLVVHLPANEVGLGYRFTPGDGFFRLSSRGIEALNAKGEPLAKGIVDVNGYEIAIPAYRAELVGQTRWFMGCTGTVSGAGGRLTVENFGRFGSAPPGRESSATSLTLFHQDEALPFYAGKDQPDSYLRVLPDFQAFPVRKLLFDNTDLRTEQARRIEVDWSGQISKAGEQATVRAFFLDADECQTVPSPRFYAYVNQTSALSPDRGRWRPAPLRREGEGDLHRLTIPDQPTNVYTVRIVLAPEGKARPDAPLHLDFLISIHHGEEGGSVSAFFQNGRDAFFEGEPLRFTIAARAPEPLKPSQGLRVFLNHGTQEMLVAERAVEPFQGSCSFTFDADREVTSLLAPGRYRIVPRLGGLRSFAAEFEIVPRQKKTRFEIAFFNKYNRLGRELADLLPAGTDPGQRRMKALVGDVAKLGFNSLQDLNYLAFRGVSRSPRAQEIEDLVRLTPGSPAPEARYIPDGVESLLNECVRHNIAYDHVIMTCNDLDLPHSFEPDMRVCRRQGVLMAERIRRFPCVRGMNMWEEVYWSSSVHTANYDLKMRRYAERFREKFGVSLKDVKRLLQPQFTSRPRGQRSVAALRSFVAEARFRAEQFAALADFLDAPTREILDRPENGIHYYTSSTLGSDLPKGYVPSMYRRMQWVRAHYYTDQASSAPVHNMFQAELYRLPGKKTCVYVPSSLNLPDCRFGRGEMLGVLGQKVAGFGLWAFPYDWGGDASGYTAGYQSMYRDFLERYGDLFLGLQRSYKKVAILNYFTPMALDPHKRVAAGSKVREFWIGCLRAGFPAEVFYEEEIEDPYALDGYQALIVPGIQWEEELSQKQLDFLMAQKKAGKTIVVEKDSVLPIEGIVHVDDCVDRIGASREALFFTWFDFEYWWLIDRSDGITETMRKALSKILDPVATTDSTRLLFGLQGYKDSRYLFVSGYEPPPLKGGGFRQQIPMAPQIRTIRVPAQPGVCYDVMEMKEVPLKDEGKLRSFPADLRCSEGKLYAFLPERVGRVEASVPSAIIGSAFRCEVVVAGESGRPLPALVPIEITLRRPDGSVASQVYRAAGPAWAEEVRFGLNDRPGTWRVDARELLTGLVASHEVHIGPPKQFPLTLAAHVRLDERRVIIHDGEPISRFLRDKGREVVIPLDRGQARLRPTAEALAKALSERGLKASVADLDSLLVPFDPKGNDEYHGLRGGLIQPGFVIEKHAIVLGRRGESRLIESALSQGILPERLTGHYPGSGKALVAFAWQPFGTQHDAVFVLSQDEAGLRAGVDRLLALAAQPSGERYRVRAEPTAPRADQAPATSASTQTRRTDPYSARAKLYDPITVVAANGSTRRIAIGTAGLQRNVACLDYDGRILWHRHVPDYDVCRLQFSDDGARLLASVKWDNKNYVLSAKDGSEVHSADSLYVERMAGNGDEFQLKRSWPIQWDTKSGRLFLVGDLGIYAVDADGKLLWSEDLWERLGEFYTVDVNNTKRLWQDWLFGSALSPDGKHLAVIQLAKLDVAGSASYPFYLLTLEARCFDAATGRPLWSAPLPTFQQSHSLALEFSPDGQSLTFRAGTGDYVTFNLKGEQTGRGLSMPSDDGPELDPTADVGVTCASATSPDGGTLYRAYMSGEVKAFDAKTGAFRWKAPVGAPCELTVLPGDDGIVAGSFRGDVTRVSPDGKVLWTVDLAADSIPGTQAEIDRLFAERPRNDVSDVIYGADVDRDGDLDGVVKFSPNQLVNGDGEARVPIAGNGRGWRSSAGKLAVVSPGRSGKNAFRLAADELLDQRVEENVAPLATYLLEFWYRPEPDAAVLSAAVLAAGREEAVYTMDFTGRAGRWSFGRLAVKSLQDTTALQIGFQASGGAVCVDDARLRKLRFPSANYLFSPDVHRLTPIWTEDAYTTFRGVTGTVRSKIQNVVFVPDARSPTGRFVEPAFLQNGRLDDVKSRWFLLPSYQRFTIFLNFKAPTTVSHVAIYFNHLHPRNVVKSFLLYGFDTEQNKEVILARVRANRKVFCLLRFEPRKLNYIKICQLGSPDEDRTFTEIAAYGSLAGPDAQKGFPKEEPFVMFHGDAAHTWSTIDYDIELPFDREAPRQFHDLHGRHTTSVQSSPMAVGYGLMYLSTAQGLMTAREMTGRWPQKWAFETRGAAPLSYPALYGGRVLFGCADGMVYCLRADSGSLIWERKTGQRVVSSPTPTPDLVFIGSCDGLLCALDLENGDPVWAFKTQAPVHASPAVAGGRVYCASRDGRVFALEEQTGRLLWQQHLGAETLSSPSVAEGIVAIGTEGGEVATLDASDGSVRWRYAMGDLVGTTPIVRGGRVYAVADNGRAAAIAVENGKPLWSHQATGPVRCEPVLLKTQLMVSAGPSLLILDANTGKPIGKDAELTNGKRRWNGIGTGVWPLNLLPLRSALHINARAMFGEPIGVGVFHLRAQLQTLWKAPPPPPKDAKK